MPPAKNPYEVLRLPATASQQDIDAAYARLKGLLADDTLASYGMMDPEQALILTRELDEAYAQLGEVSHRSAFDRGQHPWAIEAALKHESVADEQPDDGGDRRPRPQGFDAPLAAEAATMPPPLREPRPRRPQLAELHVPAEALEGRKEALDGALLRTLREAAEASLDDVSEMTKINRRYLIALENDDFALLPAGVYVRGFVSEYLRALGVARHGAVDAKVWLNSYIARYQSWRAQA